MELESGTGARLLLPTRTLLETAGAVRSLEMPLNRDDFDRDIPRHVFRCSSTVGPTMICSLPNRPQNSALIANTSAKTHSAHQAPRINVENPTPSGPINMAIKIRKKATPAAVQRMSQKIRNTSDDQGYSAGRVTRSTPASRVIDETPGYGVSNPPPLVDLLRIDGLTLPRDSTGASQT